MIDTVLKEVREAEEKAELMQKQAYQRGKDIVLKAEAEAEAQKKSTVKECKEERLSVLAEARKRASERAQSILDKGAEDANFLADEKNSAVEDSADKVVEVDKIVTSNISDKYLPNILIGYINVLNVDANNITKSCQLTPAVDFEHLEEVLVITQLKQSIEE